MKKKQSIKAVKAWAVTDWGGGIKNPSVSIFDTKKDSQIELDKLNKLPTSTIEGEPNKIIRVLITPLNKKK